jgi:hypothetical protein
MKRIKVIFLFIISVLAVAIGIVLSIPLTILRIAWQQAGCNCDDISLWATAADRKINTPPVKSKWEERIEQMQQQQKNRAQR